MRLEIALLGHLFSTAIKAWRLGIAFDPVSNIRRPPPAPGRTRRPTAREERAILKKADRHSNTMFAWIIRLALEPGMRTSELNPLRLTQVDLERRVVRLNDTRNGSQRTVPLSLEAQRVVRLAIANPRRPKHTDLAPPKGRGRDGKVRPQRFPMKW